MKIDIWCILSVVLLSCLVIYAAIWYYDGSYTNEAYDKACKDVGMVKAVYNIDGVDYCLGKVNREATFECEGFAWNKKCKANLIE